jgi:LuxR family maltose regulon positive regulatory protein
MQGLAHCAQAASGKRGFGDSFMLWMQNCSDAREAATGWLAEVAELSGSVLLLLDEVDLLPSRTQTEVLSYLLGQAPANLHIALAARPTSAWMASGTLSVAPVMRVIASDLRFRLEETLGDLLATLAARTALLTASRAGGLIPACPTAVGWPGCRRRGYCLADLSGLSAGFR